MTDIKEIKIGRHINLAMITGYKENKQLIFGITANMEEESYEYVEYNRNKYELNLWLFLISFHITIYGRSR